MEIKKGDPIAWYCSYHSGDENKPKEYTLSDYGTVIGISQYSVTIEWVGLNGGGKYKENHGVTEYNINFRYDRAEARNRAINEVLNG